MLFPYLSLAIAMHQEVIDGRYEGLVHFSAYEQPLVLDIDHGGGGGAMRGSAVLPGLGVHGAHMEKIEVDGSKLAFTLQELGGISCSGRFENGHFLGTFIQSGNTANFDLKRIGPAQVDAPIKTPAAAFSPNLIGTWSGDFVFLYKRNLTVHISNVNGHGAATFVVKGKRTSTFNPDLILQTPHFVQLTDSPTGITIEAHPNSKSNTISARVTISGIESDVVLTRTKESK